MGRACRAYESKKAMHGGFGLENQKERAPLEDLGINRVTLKWLQKNRKEDMEWIHLHQNMD
jgi:hypothetical protein